MNLCSDCKEDFGSVSSFDAHRIGKHAYTYEQGLNMIPAVKDGRRCLSIEEMIDIEWHQDSRGAWRQPAADPDALLRLRDARRAAES